MWGLLCFVAGVIACYFINIHVFGISSNTRDVNPMIYLLTRTAEFICLLGMFGVGYFVLLATG